MIRFIILSILTIVSVSGSHHLYGRDVEKFTKEVQRIFDELDMTGLGVAVVKDDSIIYHQSFGYRQLPTDTTTAEPLANDHLFRIASISKTFVATVIMQYIEEGKLSLNDDAQKYLNFPLRNPLYSNIPITIEQLLTHTSSINDSKSWWNVNVIDPGQYDDYHKCYSRTAPGNGYKYCNMNYTLLGAVIENISRNKFFNEIDSRIMKPLALGGGFNCNDLDSSKFVRLYRYKKNLRKYVEDDEAYRPYNGIIDRNYKLGNEFGLAYPASGMKITTGDLARYMMMHMYGGELDGIRIISEDSEKLMQKNFVGRHNYGLSFRHYYDLYPGKTLTGQTGGGHGLKSAMIFDPNEKVGFVIISSGSKSDVIDGYADIHKPIIHLAYRWLFDYTQQY